MDGQHVEEGQEGLDFLIVVNDAADGDLHQEDQQGNPAPHGQNPHEPEPQEHKRKRRAGGTAHETASCRRPLPPACGGWR